MVVSKNLFETKTKLVETNNKLSVVTNLLFNSKKKFIVLTN